MVLESACDTIRENGATVLEHEQYFGHAIQTKATDDTVSAKCIACNEENEITGLDLPGVRDDIAEMYCYGYFADKACDRNIQV